MECRFISEKEIFSERKTNGRLTKNSSITRGLRFPDRNSLESTFLFPKPLITISVPKPILNSFQGTIKPDWSPAADFSGSCLCVTPAQLSLSFPACIEAQIKTLTLLLKAYQPERLPDRLLKIIKPNILYQNEELHHTRNVQHINSRTCVYYSRECSLVEDFNEHVLRAMVVKYVASDRLFV